MLNKSEVTRQLITVLLMASFANEELANVCIINGITGDQATLGMNISCIIVGIAKAVVVQTVMETAVAINRSKQILSQGEPNLNTKTET